MCIDSAPGTDIYRSQRWRHLLSRTPWSTTSGAPTHVEGFEVIAHGLPTPAAARHLLVTDVAVADPRQLAAVVARAIRRGE
jgi:hypothetical protein